MRIHRGALAFLLIFFGVVGCSSTNQDDVKDRNSLSTSTTATAISKATEIANTEDFVTQREESFFLNAAVGWKAEYRFWGMFREEMVLYHTVNAGENWEKIADSMADESTLPPGIKSGIVFVDEKRGWMTTNGPWDGKVGLYRSTDGGVSWQLTKVKVPERLLADELHVSPPLFLEEKTGFLFVKSIEHAGLLFYTDDEGEHWNHSDQNEGELHGVKWIKNSDGLYEVTSRNGKYTLN
jgi:photosystem II stability/assembly factor-like uncharacterized protein